MTGQELRTLRTYPGPGPLPPGLIFQYCEALLDRELRFEEWVELGVAILHWTPQLAKHMAEQYYPAYRLTRPANAAGESGLKEGPDA